MQLEDGLPSGGVEVSVRVTGKDAAARQVEQAGLQLYAQVDDIIVGNVPNAAALKRIAELDCVEEVQISRPLYPDRPDSTGKES
jgi:hypothetical protein